MAKPWIEMRKRRDKSISYWVRDRRNGVEIVISGGNSFEQALAELQKYKARRDLEKEGYDDMHQATIDKLWEKRRDHFRRKP